MCGGGSWEHSMNLTRRADFVTICGFSFEAILREKQRLA